MKIGFKLGLTFLLLVACHVTVQSKEITSWQKDGYYLTEEDFENGRKIDLANQTSNGEIDPLDAAIKYGKANYQGDIMLTPDQLQQIKGTGRALDPIAKLWPDDGIVPHVRIPYIITDNTFTTDEKANIARAVEEFEKNTCIRIVPWHWEDDYIVINRSGKCRSAIGKIGGRQTISLDWGCAYNVGTPIHEFMHALGFKHEQARNDRDDHVTIIWNNIEDGSKSQFGKCKDCDNQDSPYDHASVMHYSSNAFSKNGRPTIIAKNHEEMGQRNGFSYYDLVELNKAYSCNQGWPSRCSSGYQFKEGDIVGCGFGGSREISKEKCADRCGKTHGCNSYQFSLTADGTNCCIHAGGQSEIQGRTYRDFFMCFKAGSIGIPIYVAKRGAECNSNDENLGSQVSFADCANACKEKTGCKYFIYGYGVKDKRCWWEKTQTADCPEGWEPDDYNLYEMTKSTNQGSIGIPIYVAKRNAECYSNDENLGNQVSFADCAKVCKEKTGCKYFIYGYGSKAKRCWWEKTKTADCPEGWEYDEYNFYEIKEDKLWPEEAVNQKCQSYTWETGYDQLGCQVSCESLSNCVGVLRTHKQEYWDSCYKCYDDNLTPAPNGFGFYRRPD